MQTMEEYRYLEEHKHEVMSEEGYITYHESWDEDHLDFERADSSREDDDCYSRPIVVGYSFGAKKMSTMGVVMAEATQTRIVRTHIGPNRDNEEQAEQKEDRTSSSTRQIRSSVGAINAASSKSNDEAIEEGTNQDYKKRHCTDRSTPKSQQKNDTTVILSIDRHSDGTVVAGNPLGLNNIIRRFATRGSSIRDDSSTNSTGTRTASTATTFASLKTGSVPSSSTHDTTIRTNTNNFHITPIRVSFVPLDPEIPLDEQHGGIDIILHKLTEDLLLLSQLSVQHAELKSVLQMNDAEALLEKLPLSSKDLAAIRRVHRLCQFQKQHGCLLVDDPVCVQTLMSRADIAVVLDQCLSNVTTSTGMPVRSPRYAVAPDLIKKQSGGVGETCAEQIAQRLKHAELNFPIIVKPLTAAGTKASHSMAVVTQASGLEQITDRLPCLLQEYVNHDAVLYKVYVLGEFVSVHKRRSLPNLPTGATGTETNAVVEFDSQRPYPRLRDFGCTTEESPSQSSGNPKTSDSTKAVAPSFTTGCSKSSFNNHNSMVTTEQVQPIVSALKNAFGLAIFGFDILITSGTTPPCMIVVDVNYFPSYKEVPNFPALLAKFLTSKAVSRRMESSQRKRS